MILDFDMRYYYGAMLRHRLATDSHDDECSTHAHCKKGMYWMCFGYVDAMAVYDAQKD